MAHVNQLTNAELERLSMLAEECGEVVQMVNKIIRHGYASHHPDGGPNNRTVISQEICDIEAVLSMMRAKNDIPHLTSKDILATKEKKKRYTHYQE